MSDVEKFGPFTDWKHKTKGDRCDAGHLAPSPTAQGNPWWCTKHEDFLVYEGPITDDLVLLPLERIQAREKATDERIAGLAAGFLGHPVNVGPDVPIMMRLLAMCDKLFGDCETGPRADFEDTVHDRINKFLDDMEAPAREAVAQHILLQGVPGVDPNAR